MLVPSAISALWNGRRLIALASAHIVVAGSVLQAERELEREDEAALAHYVEREHALAAIRTLSKDIRCAALNDAQLARQEARLAWRLRRWDLFEPRQRRLEV